MLVIPAIGNCALVVEETFWSAVYVFPRGANPVVLRKDVVVAERMCHVEIGGDQIMMRMKKRKKNKKRQKRVTTARMRLGTNKE